MVSAAAPLAILLAAAPALGHGVVHHTGQASAFTVTFTYADGSPIAFADYQVHGPQDPRPAAVGLTDRAGRVAFLPDRPGPWTVRVTTADGHGKTVELAITEDQLDGAAADHAGDDVAGGGTARWLRALLGVGLILLVALILSTVLRRAGRRAPGDQDATHGDG
ncbi:hypothetical protein GF314_13980 [bacterium]|nr:hypothetical protein [bacterium]